MIIIFIELNDCNRHSERKIVEYENIHKGKICDKNVGRFSDARRRKLCCAKGHSRASEHLKEVSGADSITAE